MLNLKSRLKWFTPVRFRTLHPLYTHVFITHFFKTFRYEGRVRIGLFIKRNNKNMRLVVFYCINSSCPFKLNDEKRLAHCTYRLLVDGELCGGSEFEPHLDLAALQLVCVWWVLTYNSVDIRYGACWLAKNVLSQHFFFSWQRKSVSFFVVTIRPQKREPRQKWCKKMQNSINFPKIHVFKWQHQY